MRLPDIDKVSALIAEVAALAVTPHFRNLAMADIGEKAGPYDLVTIADTESERLLAPRLAELAPGAKIVGEEAASKQPELMDVLRQDGAVWLIDPVDGTANFAVGIPLFAVMVCYVVNGDAQIAWIHDPLRGVTATAERGNGAWLAGQRLHVARPESLAHMAGAPNIRYGDRKLASRIGERCDRLASLILPRCAGQEYTMIAEGRMHFAIYNRALPWDHACGALLVTEAGGIAKRLNGEMYRAADKPWGSPLMIAPDAERWQWLYDGLIAD